MRFEQRLIAAAAAIAVVTSAGPALAHGYNGDAIDNNISSALFNYSGAWPVTITRSQRSNGTGCLTLNGIPAAARLRWSLAVKNIPSALS
jgi:hypothetical protein